MIRPTAHFLGFLKHLTILGETVKDRIGYWMQQFDLLKEGIDDGRINDSALIAFSRFPTKKKFQFFAYRGH